MSRPFESHELAVRKIRQMIEKLPLDMQWAAFISSEDDMANPSVFNIFTEGQSEWGYLRNRLLLPPKPVDEDTDFISFRVDNLLISLVEIKRGGK